MTTIVHKQADPHRPSRTTYHISASTRDEVQRKIDELQNGEEVIASEFTRPQRAFGEPCPWKSLGYTVEHRLEMEPNNA